MLSRVAERMYWLGRYIERCENTARLINVNGNLLLDMPRMGRQLWSSLIEISGVTDPFFNRYMKAEERHVLRFMLAEPTNPGSLINSVRNARENARVCREIIPTEAWETINEFYLYVRRNNDKGATRDGRNKYLSDVMRYCNQLVGVLFTGISHGDSYSFIRIGGSLERADMGTRIIDVGCLNLLGNSEAEEGGFNDLLWMNVLRSLGAYQMYRQHVQDRVNGKDVVTFLLKDPEFPRTTAHCLGVIMSRFQQLPRSDVPLRSVAHTQRLVNEVKVEEVMAEGLHEFIDQVQIDLAELHGEITQTWFEFSDRDAAAMVEESETTR